MRLVYRRAYTFLDSYYLRSLFVVWSTYATPFGEATLLVWFNALRSNVGNVACAAAGLAVIYALWTASRSETRSGASACGRHRVVAAIVVWQRIQGLDGCRISAGRDWTSSPCSRWKQSQSLRGDFFQQTSSRMGSNHHGRAVGRVDSDAPWHRTDQHGAGTASLAPLDGNGSQPLGL